MYCLRLPAKRSFTCPWSRPSFDMITHGTPRTDFFLGPIVGRKWVFCLYRLRTKAKNQEIGKRNLRSSSDILGKSIRTVGHLHGWRFSSIGVKNILTISRAQLPSETFAPASIFQMKANLLFQRRSMMRPSTPIQGWSRIKTKNKSSTCSNVCEW